MPKITLQKDAKDVVVITGDHGGYTEGYCFACNASGWIKGQGGYPNCVKNTPGSHLKHEVECPMNVVLNNDGSLK